MVARIESLLVGLDGQGDGDHSGGGDCKVWSPIGWKMAWKRAKLLPGMATLPTVIATTTGFDGGLKSSTSMRGNHLG